MRSVTRARFLLLLVCRACFCWIPSIKDFFVTGGSGRTPTQKVVDTGGGTLEGWPLEGWTRTLEGRTLKGWTLEGVDTGGELGDTGGGWTKGVDKGGHWRGWTLEGWTRTLEGWTLEGWALQGPQSLGRSSPGTNQNHLEYWGHKRLSPVIR